MNSVDAGATRCEITLDAAQLAIADDGRGFADRGEVERFFEVFGQPHDDAEKAQKTYGTFRMGRGQLFAYGKNRWGSGPLRMDVDIQGAGLGYTLREAATPVPGCVILVDLYAPLLPSELAETERTIRRWVKWAPIAVTWGGARISQDPARAKWDHTTDDAFVRLTDSGSLAVYNLGVQVCDLGNYRYGCGGEVVSRRQLAVNFARNDIQSTCPVWKRIVPLVNRMATAANTRKPALNDGERQRLADQLRQGELTWDQGRKLKLITAVTGRHHPLQDLNRHEGVAACPKGNLIGDKLHQMGQVFILADETLERFGFPRTDDGVAELVAWLATLTPANTHWWPKAVDFAAVAGSFNEAHYLLDAKDLTATEEVWLQVADRMQSALLGPAGWRLRRVLRVGRSDTADGWTDGARYIVLNRAFLAERTLTVAGLVDLGHLVLHELCHTGPDTAEHVHGPEFHARYHDDSRRLGRAVAAAFTLVPSFLDKAGKRLTRKQLRDRDKAVKAERAAAAMPAIHEGRHV
jgi:hypothetical protein